MRRLLILTLAASVVSLIVSCQTRSPVTPWSESPIPAPTETSQSLFFSPTTAPPSPLLVWPTPAEGTAVVGGIIFHEQSDASWEPMVNAWLGLARLVTADDNQTKMARFSEKESPRTMANADGEFVFTNVSPDSYSLVVIVAGMPNFMRDYETGENIVFTVEAGETFDLGEIRFTSPR